MTESWLWDLANQIQNRIPDPIDYVEMRRKTFLGSDDEPVLTGSGRRVPPEIYRTRSMRQLDNSAADFACLTNDIFSYQKEKVSKISIGKHDEQTVLSVLADGDYFGDRTLVESQSNWQFTIQAITRCTVLALPQQAFRELLNQSQALQAHVDHFRTRPQVPQNKYGEASIELTSGLYRGD